MATYADRVEETISYLKNRLGASPQVGLLTGTGLGEVIGGFEEIWAMNYEEIPHLPVSTVQSHAGRLVCGRLSGKTVLALQGRFHLYEGYSPLEVTFPVRLMAGIGIDTLILSNAAGGFNPAFAPGDLMIINDHINLTGENPLLGPNPDDWGPRFPDMSRAYDPGLIEKTILAGRQEGVGLQRGVYAGLKGPSLETPAEIRYLRSIGADAVGFSTVMETIAGVHAGMHVLGISTITNTADPDHPKPADLDEIIETANAAAPSLAALIAGVLGQL
ncbi:MAG: purine-nucleoside phosphorylase [Desulfobacteraceae bacterium]|nr:purine-nucleoside phosphorylase [Desulfobacteraceae bacterium]